MKRTNAKELLPIIQAFAEGKDIEYSYDGEHWESTNTPSWDCNVMYRIKAEPKYRPFKTKEECWDEMHCHSDFGWVKYDDSISAVQNIAPDGITVTDGIETNNFYFEECFVNMKFVDGTPFGIKEE